ncbi:MAG: 7-carboxy-7-deazaguanine synthase QueE [Bacteroidales bacterium]|nr:7-carboxy-7-deazaguanine synthase QueE [Bacteroidales bacterium]
MTLDPTRNGTLLPLMEDFYTLQGEGAHTGKASYFLRVGGCDVGCYWCDVKESWNPSLHPLTPVDEIIRRAVPAPSKTIVLTGGEPLMYNLNPLCDGLHKEGLSIHLETSGSHPFSGSFEWICLSPKRKSPPLDEIFPLASELKVIIFDESDFAWAEENAAKVSQTCQLFLQPEWSRMKEVVPSIIDYVMQHPRWKISLQTHKYLHIP